MAKSLEVAVQELKEAVKREQESTWTHEERQRDLQCSNTEQQRADNLVIQRLEEAVGNARDRMEAAEGAASCA